MKPYCILLLTFICSLAANAQFTTITVATNASLIPGSVYGGGILTVPTNSVACLKSAWSNSGIYFRIKSGGMSVEFAKPDSLADKPIVIVGPATIQLVQGTEYPPSAFATFLVEPGPYPPNKTVTVGAYAGNVQVTMQMSTDLVNWAPAVNGLFYTNSPDARFFRIQLTAIPQEIEKMVGSFQRTCHTAGK